MSIEKVKMKIIQVQKELTHIMLNSIFPRIGHPSLISSAPKEWAANKSSTYMPPAIPHHSGLHLM
jgi:hypothetical protein